MNVNVKVDTSGVVKKAADMVKRGQYALVNQVHADTNLYVPKLSSDLRNHSTISTDGKSIIWNEPYARWQYYNYGAKYSTPGTGPKWDSKALTIHKSSWERVAKNGM